MTALLEYLDTLMQEIGQKVEEPWSPGSTAYDQIYCQSWCYWSNQSQ